MLTGMTISTVQVDALSAKELPRRRLQSLLSLMMIGVPEADMPISHVNKANERQRNKRKKKQR
jgi:hypothetical protein